MAQFITMTSQGQISIPAKVRRHFNLDHIRKLWLKIQDNKIILEPAHDIMELEGIFQDYAIKDKPIEEIMKLEKEALPQAFAEKYKKRLKS